MADLHGDLAAARQILSGLHLVDGRDDWIGGTAVLVQTGDLIDRGRDSRGVLKWFFHLQDQAREAGGQVILLFGNHEVMHLQGLYDYLHPDELTDTGGLAAWHALWAPDGELGRLVRARLQALALVGGTLFSHAGPLPRLAEAFAAAAAPGASGPAVVEAFNTWVHMHLAAGRDALANVGNMPDEMRLHFLSHGWADTSLAPAAGSATDFLNRNPGLVFGSSGPFWCGDFGRGAADDASDVCGLLQQTLSVFGVARLVLGHMPQAGGHVRARCGGRLILADTAISEAIDGPGLNHPSALEIDSATGGAVAHYWPPLRTSREVSCGGHRAASCPLCGDAPDFCNGMCTWQAGRLAGGRCELAQPPLPPEGQQLQLPRVELPQAVALPRLRAAGEALPQQPAAASAAVAAAAVDAGAGLADLKLITGVQPPAGAALGFGPIFAVALAGNALVAWIVLSKLFLAKGSRRNKRHRGVGATLGLW